MTDNKNPNIELEMPVCPCDSVDAFVPDDSGPVIKVFKFLIITSNILVAILVSSAAFMRYVLEMDLYGVDEFILLAAFILYFSGSVYGAHRNQHICADIISNYLKNIKAKRVMGAITSFLTFGLSAVFSWLGVNMFTWQWATQGKTQIWRIPLWVTQGFIALCLILMSVYFLIWFIRSLKALRDAWRQPATTAIIESGKE